MERGKFEALEKEEQYDVYGGEQKGNALLDDIREFITRIFGIENTK